MGTEVKMPQLGETVVEGTITKWLKQEGDQVDADELLVEISTDKVDSEVPSSAAGTLQKILVQEGETVKVGTPLAVIGDAGEGGSDGEAQESSAEAQESSAEEPDGEAQESPPEEPAAEAQPQEEDEEPEPQAAEDKEAGRKEELEREEEATASDEGQAAQGGGGGDSEQARSEEGDGDDGSGSGDGDTSKRGIISPLVRKLADEHGVDLDEIQGSGTGGRIRKQDVLRFVEEKKARPQAKPAASAEPAPEQKPAGQEKQAPAAKEERPAAAAGDREELVPWTNIRRRTAEHMVAAHLESARAWNAVEVDWSEVVSLRGRAKGPFKEREGFNLTYLPFLAKAVCETLLEMPEVNSTFDEENQANRLKHYVNLGIAVALEGGGLIVPVVKGADEKNVVGLARAINDIVTRARSKKLSPDDLAGGSFTITNPGPFGSIMSVPIILRGQTAILAFEAIQKRVVVTDDDAMAIRSMGFLPMAWDHRAIDGAEAARFLATLRDRIEDTDWSSEVSQYI